MPHLVALDPKSSFTAPHVPCAIGDRPNEEEGWGGDTVTSRAYLSVKPMPMPPRQSQRQRQRQHEEAEPVAVAEGQWKRQQYFLLPAAGRDYQNECMKNYEMVMCRCHAAAATTER